MGMVCIEGIARVVHQKDCFHAGVERQSLRIQLEMGPGKGVLGNGGLSVGTPTNDEDC